MMEKNYKNIFETKIKPVLVYVGTIGAILSSIAYIAMVCVLIFGFTARNFVQTLVFAIINGVAGVIIMQMLKIQGQDFAKKIPENEEILKEYYNTKTKDKKIHSMKYFWIKTTISDVISKGLSIVFSTACIIYIIIQGSDDYVLLLLAFVNLVMFFCFGIISLAKAYDFFNEQHMVYVKEQLKIYKEEEAMKEKTLKKAITPSESTESFRDFLKQNNKEIVAAYYGFSPYENISSNEDVTYYKEN